MLLAKNKNDVFEFVKVMYKTMLVLFFPETVYMHLYWHGQKLDKTWLDQTVFSFDHFVWALPCLSRSVYFHRFSTALHFKHLDFLLLFFVQHSATFGHEFAIRSDVGLIHYDEY